MFLKEVSKAANKVLTKAPQKTVLLPYFQDSLMKNIEVN